MTNHSRTRTLNIRVEKTQLTRTGWKVFRPLTSRHLQSMCFWPESRPTAIGEAAQQKWGGELGAPPRNYFDKINYVDRSGVGFFFYPDLAEFKRIFRFISNRYWVVRRITLPPQPILTYTQSTQLWSTRAAIAKQMRIHPKCSTAEEVERGEWKGRETWI